MTDQLDLFSTGQIRSHTDPEAADAARDAAIAGVEAAHLSAAAMVRAAVRGVARTRDEFTTDDVWAVLADNAEAVAEPRLMGAVIQRMSRNDEIRPTGTYRKSARPVCHSRPVKVWKSTRGNL